MKEGTIDYKMLLLGRQYELCNAFYSDSQTLSFQLQIMQLFPIVNSNFLLYSLCSPDPVGQQTSKRKTPNKNSLKGDTFY